MNPNGKLISLSFQPVKRFGSISAPEKVAEGHTWWKHLQNVGIWAGGPQPSHTDKRWTALFWLSRII